MSSSGGGSVAARVSGIVVEVQVFGAWVPMTQPEVEQNTDAKRIRSRVQKVVRSTGNECCLVSRGYRARTTK